MVNGPNSVSTRNSSPSTWWEKDYTKPLDFSRPGDFLHLGIPLWSDNTKLVSSWISNGDWALRNQYHPMTVSATIVAVAKGIEFSGWDRWIGKTISVNSVGNTDNVLTFSNITPSSNGEIVIRMSKLDGEYGYINALIIKKAFTTDVSVMDKEVIKCYPSPVKDTLTLTNLQEQSHIEVYDIRGSKVIETKNGAEDSMQINMSALKAGSYMVKVSNPSFSENIKIIKI